ncbi:isocitrate lyase/PEP mutase family protein [Streptacidiphilus rugosus]|uniref:isocitrate lyase/PEP mutase family protein n=1 Tax=Streptacidiphilus rugosus TaxID=405783 RepID=UPI0005664951|nr:isocitrate lyase/phosphoenolpyruvate mutase family protein [Streptacidiphilus rugosus]
MTTSNDAAAILRALHVPGKPLVLANAWDVASARLVEGAGFPAVATASAAIAPTLGYDDHEQTPPEEMFAAVARIRRAVSVPVTADLEGGYGLEPAEFVERLAATGAVGANIEDTDAHSGGLRPAERQAEYLAGIRAAADAAGYDLVLNARVDVYLHDGGSDAERLAEALRRGRLYREAGADSLYPILVADAPTIEALVEGLDAPVNILARPGVPTVGELAGLGVARISFGPGMFRIAQAATEAALRAVADGRSPFAP